MESDGQKLAIIGCGFMGSAILQGLLEHPPSPTLPKLTYSAHVHTLTSLTRLKQAFSPYSELITFTYGNSQLLRTISAAKIVLLGIHPHSLTTFFSSTPDLANYLRGKILISMLAGTSTYQILRALESHSPPGPSQQDFYITRIIPTLSAKIGESVTLIAEPSSVSASSSANSTVVDAIFSRIGSIHHIPENLMDTATAIGAAMHALAIVAVDTATDASVASGMPRATALALTAQCLRSCTGLMLQGGMTPESVKAAMSTPGGITLNSVVRLDENVRSGIAGTVRGAVEYTKGMNR